MNDNSGQKKTMGGAPKKESILELAKLMDATVRVKCIGGRELQGVLRGYDDLVNLVLDECEEFLRGMFGVCCLSQNNIPLPFRIVLLTFTYQSCFLLTVSRSGRYRACNGQNKEAWPHRCSGDSGIARLTAGRRRGDREPICSRRRISYAMEITIVHTIYSYNRVLAKQEILMPLH
jgi:small nuclear ribonucleoprotein (snRNP)-like protein